MIYDIDFYKVKFSQIARIRSKFQVTALLSNLMKWHFISDNFNRNLVVAPSFVKRWKLHFKLLTIFRDIFPCLRLCEILVLQKGCYNQE